MWSFIYASDVILQKRIELKVISQTVVQEIFSFKNFLNFFFLLVGKNTNELIYLFPNNKNKKKKKKVEEMLKCFVQKIKIIYFWGKNFQ